VDIRYFLSRLAREVRRGRLELHAWCLLSTHYHLLVRSPAGRLSEAMRRTQNEHSRFFNRRHLRKGTLIQGRFLSRPVDSLAYRRLLVRYIDAMPVKSQIAKSCWEYPWCSSWHYVRGKGPPWMERSWIESEVSSRSGSGSFVPGEYPLIFGNPPSEGASSLIEDRLQRPSGQDDLDDLIQATPPRIQQWLVQRSRLDSDSNTSLPVCSVDSVRRAVSRGESSVGDWVVKLHRRRRDAWKVAEAGLLRDLAGLSWQQMARATGLSPSTCARYTELHTERLQEDAEYAERTSTLAGQALSNCFAACD